jgi:hypothetical protein
MSCHIESKQQTCVAMSTCEAEYYSAADATKEGFHLRHLMGEIFNAPIANERGMHGSIRKTLSLAVC